MAKSETRVVPPFNVEEDMQIENMSGSNEAEFCDLQAESKGQAVPKNKGKLPAQKKVVYYAHSMKKYNTAEETSELELIKTKFKGDKIVNPKELGIERGPEITEFSMEYVRSVAEVVVFSEFRGFIGKGVYQEIIVAMQRGIPVYLLRNRSFILNPRVEMNDHTDWAIRYARVCNFPSPDNIKFGKIPDLEGIIAERKFQSLVREFVAQFKLNALRLNEAGLCQFLGCYDYDRSVHDVQLALWRIYYYVDCLNRGAIPVKQFGQRLRDLGFVQLAVTIQYRAKQDITQRIQKLEELMDTFLQDQEFQSREKALFLKILQENLKWADGQPQFLFRKKGRNQRSKEKIFFGSRSKIFFRFCEVMMECGLTGFPTQKARCSGVTDHES